MDIHTKQEDFDISELLAKLYGGMYDQAMFHSDASLTHSLFLNSTLFTST